MARWLARLCGRYRTRVRPASFGLGLGTRLFSIAWKKIGLAPIIFPHCGNIISTPWKTLKPFQRERRNRPKNQQENKKPRSAGKGRKAPCHHTEKFLSCFPVFLAFLIGFVFFPACVFCISGDACVDVLRLVSPFYFFGGASGAGDGNRTHVASLEGWSSTIELRPLRMQVGAHCARGVGMGQVPDFRAGAAGRHARRAPSPARGFVAPRPATAPARRRGRIGGSSVGLG